MALLEAQSRTAVREDAPTGPDGFDHASLAIFTPQVRDHSTPFGKLGLAVLLYPEGSVEVWLSRSVSEVGATSTLPNASQPPLFSYLLPSGIIEASPSLSNGMAWAPAGSSCADRSEANGYG
jgi:hypothetical protein